jgi:hypothetical protein
VNLEKLGSPHKGNSANMKRCSTSFFSSEGLLLLLALLSLLLSLLLLPLREGMGCRMAPETPFTGAQQITTGLSSRMAAGDGPPAVRPRAHIF